MSETVQVSVTLVRLQDPLMILTYSLTRRSSPLTMPPQRSLCNRQFLLSLALGP